VILYTQVSSLVLSSFRPLSVFLLFWDLSSTPIHYRSPHYYHYTGCPNAIILVCKDIQV
jgi:hypothetical protein